MKRCSQWALWALVFSASVVRAEEPRTVDSILAEVAALGEVDFEMRRKSEPGYIEDYLRRLLSLGRKKAGLLLEACRLAPTDPRVADWMPQRWRLLSKNQDPALVADEVLADIDKYLPEFNHPVIAQEAAYYRALHRAHKAKPDFEAMYKHVSEFTQAYPTDPRGAGLLQTVADAVPPRNELAQSIYRNLGQQYFGTHIGKFAPGKLRQLDSLGNPFELAFNDVVNGRFVSIADYRGKVVMIEFWTSKCPGCLEEIPRLKQLYARLRDRGVEFIGVSLDLPESDGGLKSLKELVARARIPWPQFYQGDGNNSEFSKAWGVGSTPTKFLVDREGNFRGTVAADELEERILALLGE